MLQMGIIEVRFAHSLDPDQDRESFAFDALQAGCCDKIDLLTEGDVMVVQVQAAAWGKLAQVLAAWAEGCAWSQPV